MVIAPLQCGTIFRTSFRCNYMFCSDTISRVSSSSYVLFDSSIDAKGSFLAENSIPSIMTLDGRRLRGDRRSGTGLCCGLHWAATTAAPI